MPVTTEALGRLLLKEHYDGITQTYLNYLAIRKGYHPGIDYRARTPLKVYSPVEGKVAYVGGAYGTASVKIEETNIYFMFLHLSKFNLKIGDKVSFGTIIGLTGSVGAPGQPHLHVEARKNFMNAAAYFDNLAKAATNVNPISVINVGR